MSKKMKIPNSLTRREALLTSALSFGSLSLRSLLTGLPTAFLLGKPESAWAAEIEAKFLILSQMQSGDPLNSNVPGTYGNPNNPNDPLHAIEHATVAELGDIAQGFESGTDFKLGNEPVRAAEVWSSLPAELLAQSAFWHHGTYVSAHPDFSAVLSLGGALKGVGGSGTDHYASFIAQENHQTLGTISKEMIRIGGSSSLSNGVPAPQLKPATLKSVFASKVNHFDRMTAMRDQFLDQAYSNIKISGTPAQRKFFDNYATSRREAQTLGDSLGELITDIDGNTQADQAKMAAALIQLKVSPVVCLGMPYGGDNHQDTNLANEVNESLASIEAIRTLWEKLNTAQITDKVVFANLHVFGRTLRRSKNGGRDHNSGHHCMYVFGDAIQSGVIGGLETYQRRSGPTGIDFRATGINSSTGKSSNPDISFEQTLSSVGKTLGAAVGITNERIKHRIETGKVITAALK